MNFLILSVLIAGELILTLSLFPFLISMYYQTFYIKIKYIFIYYNFFFSFICFNTRTYHWYNTSISFMSILFM